MTESASPAFGRLPFIGAVAGSVEAGRHVVVSAGIVYFLDAADWIFVASLVGFAITTAYHIARWLTFRIAIDGADVRSSQSFISRTERRIPIANIHDLHFEQSVVQRIFRVVTVRIETAGGSGSEAELSGLLRWQAEALKQAIEAARGRAPAERATADEDVVVSLSFRDLVLAGVGAATLWIVIGALFSAWFFVDDLIPGLEERVEPIVKSAAGFLSSADWWVLAVSTVIVVVALVIVAAFISIARTCVRYWGFRATWNGTRLSRACGLFTRRRQVLHARRIQRVLVRQSLVQRWLHVVVVELGTAAVGSREEDDHGRSFVIPILPVAELQPLFDKVCPGAQTIDGVFEPVSPVCARRYLVRSAAFLVVVSAALASWSPLSAALVWLIFAGALLRAPVLKRVTGWRLDDELVQFRTGAWARRLATIPLRRLQGSAVSETPFDRRYGVVTVEMSAAGGGNGALLSDVPAARAAEIVARALAGASRADPVLEEPKQSSHGPEDITESP